MLQKPIIEIKRASEQFTTSLIASGILIVTDTGLKCAEQKNRPTQAYRARVYSVTEICYFYA